MALDLLQTRPSKVVLVEPFAVPEASRRRRVVGLDVWLEAHPRTPIPIGSALVAALCPTHARLTHLADLDGRCAWPGDDVADATQLQGRILVRDDDTHLNDAALAEVLGAVASVASWTLLRKLEEFDGIPAFVPLSGAPRA